MLLAGSKLLFRALSLYYFKYSSLAEPQENIGGQRTRRHSLSLPAAEIDGWKDGQGAGESRVADPVKKNWIRLEKKKKAISI